MGIMRKRLPGEKVEGYDRFEVPLSKRCAMCKRTRADGAVINRGQGYCRDCFRDYERTRVRKKPGQEK
jgi:hypothetical protein